MTAGIKFDLDAIRSKLRNKNINILGIRCHTKASETYVDAVFQYSGQSLKWKISVPIEYRRTGVSVNSEDEIAELLEKTYVQIDPRHYDQWLKEQKLFWDSAKKKVTRGFFEELKGSRWKCVNCELPKNPNWARRVQDLKEFGYTMATDTKRFCENCKRNTTHLILLPVPRGAKTGYETWSPALRKRMLDTLGNIDAYENRQNSFLLPDHKFPETRWDENTRKENLDDMGEEEIRKKFQLLSNQRNQQKREVCRSCYQTGKRGYPYGIKFFYEGDENWPGDVPKKGKDAERGCHGCGWYDIHEWRKRLNKFISESSS